MEQNKSYMKWAIIGVLFLVFLIVGVLVFLRNKDGGETETDFYPENEFYLDDDHEDQFIDNGDDLSDTDATGSAAGTILAESSQNIQKKFDDMENRAYENASQWKKNTSLCAVSIKSPANLISQAITYSFIYCAPSEKTFYFNINFNDQGQYLRALVWQTDYLKPNLSALNRKYLNLNYQDALQKAEEEGGSVFRGQYPRAQITLNLYRAEPNNYAYWFIQYEDSESPEKLIKQIDANTGEFVSF